MPYGDAPTLANPSDRSRERDHVALAAQVFAVGALQIALIMGAVVAVLLLAALVIGGAPTRWIVTGAVLVAVWTLAACKPAVTARLLARRYATSALAGAFAVVIALEGTWHNPFLGVGFALVLVSGVVDSWRGVAGCVTASVVGYVVGVAVSGWPLGQLTIGPRLHEVVTNSVDFVLVALLVSAVVGALRAVLANARSTLEEVRQGAGGFTPALTTALRAADGAAPPLLPRAPASAVVTQLSDAERRVVSLLADGLAPKQAAVALDVPLATIRSRLASAKRKTGSRTLEQLVGLAAEANLQ